MRNKYMLIGLVGIVAGVLFSSAVMVLAGTNFDSPSGPTDSASQMYTLEQIYDRINDGTAATKMTTFTEPSSGPAATMHDLNAIYDLASERSRPAKTGQTTLYATGDDGDLEKGVAWPSTRFTDNSDGTVTDNLTGLMWMKNADAGNDCDGGDTGTETWANALASAAACNSGGGYAGYTDWRLPNVRELFSLIDFSQLMPALPSGHPFSNVLSAKYWVSTTYAGDTTRAWYVDLGGGYVNYILQGYSRNVWPVRGGQ